MEGIISVPHVSKRYLKKHTSERKPFPKKTRPPLQKKKVHDISSTLPSARPWKWGPKNEVSRLPSIVFILFAGAVQPGKLTWNLKMMGLQKESPLPEVHFSSSLVFRGDQRCNSLVSWRLHPKKFNGWFTYKSPLKRKENDPNHPPPGIFFLPAFNLQGGFRGVF